MIKYGMQTTPLIEKHINKETLKNIFSEEKYDDDTKDEFISFLNETLIEAEKYPDPEGDTEESFLDHTGRYIAEFINQREKGYSLEWSKVYSHSIFHDEGDHASACAFCAVK